MSSIDPTLEAVFTEQIKQQNETEEAQRESHQQMQKEIDTRRADLLRSLTSTQRKPQYDPRIIGIANALQMQPVLITPMEMFLKKLVNGINSAVQEAIVKVAGTE